MSQKVMKKMSMLSTGMSIDVPQNLELKDRLKFRINKMRHNRNGVQAQDHKDQKRRQHIQEKIDKLKTDMQTTASDMPSIDFPKSDAIKKYNKKLRDLEKKHGNILFDDYIKYLDIVTKKEQEHGTIVHAQNMVNLYLKQQMNSLSKEHTLDFSSDDE